MELGIPAKRRYFAYSVNESLLELALKLRQAEVRVKGRTHQTTVPPHHVSAGVSSTVDGGRFQFIARRNDVSENFTASKYTDNSTALAVTGGGENVVTTNRFQAVDVPVPVHTKKLSQPDRTGPSLWPFLSSIKASMDTEHVKFLEKNQKFYSSYDKSRIAEDYIKPLSETDFDIIIDNAIAATLQVHESHVPQQPSASKNESCVTAAVSVAPLAPLVPLPPLAPRPPASTNADMDVPSTFETKNIATLPAQSAVVSKRYAAAVANPRRFQCGLCPYSTKNRSHVRRHHISVHSDARPYRCYVCDKEFARCENAKVHMISRHPDVPYDVDRLRNTMFFAGDNSVPPEPITIEPIPSTSTQSSNMSGPVSAFQLQQDGISSQWPTDLITTELKRAQLERHQVIPSWISFPKIEPKLDQSIQMFGHGNMGNNLLQGIPPGMFQSDPNTMLNAQLLGSVSSVKQEIIDTKPASYPVAERHVCLYCQCVCQNAAELAKHIATSHAALNPALHAAPSSNPGYVVLQTAAPIFLFPYGSDAAPPNRNQVGLGYHPILPKLPAFSEEHRNRNEAVAGQHSSSAEAGTTQRPSLNVPKSTSASVDHLSTSEISLSASENVPESESPSATPGSVIGKRERKRQFKTFYCSRCPDRAPFRYEKSFEKHVRQHRFEDRSRKAQKIASKVA